MWRYIVRRIINMIPVLLGVSLVIFTLLYMTPGDPAALVLGEQASDESKDAWREKYGLNDSYWVQYGSYIGNIVTKGDFGVSYRTGKSVTDAIFERFPTTLLLAVMTAGISMVVGVILGIVAANNRGSWVDGVVRVFGMVGVSMPAFWFALLLIMLFALRLGWLPVSGWYGPAYWVMPGIALGLMHSASMMRITRSSMLECIRQDYVRTARSKGQAEGVITRHHVLRNALIPIITTVGNCFGQALGGAVIMEQIFSIPGLGRLMVDSINNRDYPQVRGSVLVLAASFCVINLLVDILYAYIDPRIKSQYQNTSRIRRKKEAAAA